MTFIYARRVLLDRLPSAPVEPTVPPWFRNQMSARWLRLPDTRPIIQGFRLPLRLDARLNTRLNISAAERYRLFINGQVQYVGPERGDERSWRYDTYDLLLPAGEHWIAIEVWALGAQAGMWQVPVTPGLIVFTDDPKEQIFATGRAPWQGVPLPGASFEHQPHTWFTGARLRLAVSGVPLGWQVGGPCATTDVDVGQPGSTTFAMCDAVPPMLTPAVTPPVSLEALPLGHLVFSEEFADITAARPPCDPAKHDVLLADRFTRLLAGEPLTLEPHRTVRGLIDLGTYRAFWPVVRARGVGARVTIRSTEALYVVPPAKPDETDDHLRAKDHRAQWQHKRFVGTGPTYDLDEHLRELHACDWECGRFVEIAIRTNDQPATIESIALYDTSYPLADEGRFDCDDPRLSSLRDLALHTLRVGTHSHFCDCPFYERMQYVGDTRLEALVTRTFTAASALQARALQDFARTASADGVLVSRHPARGIQFIPGFALWWVGMLHDFAYWHNDLPLVRSLLPVARAVVDHQLDRANGDGLIETPEGWPFVDWVPQWKFGIPPDGDTSPSAVHHFHMLYTLRLLIDLERQLGAAEMVPVHQARFDRLAALSDVFWQADRGRFCDSLASPGLASEHSHCLALLSKSLKPDRAKQVGEVLLSHSDLARTTIYYSHYLLEAFGVLRRPDRIFDRLGYWFDLPGQGFTTTPESPEPSRSDCHPWGTHPAFHLVATIAGLRPIAVGFSAATVDPQPGPLSRFSLTLPHAKGPITITYQNHKTQVEAPIPVTVLMPPT